VIEARRASARRTDLPVRLGGLAPQDKKYKESRRGLEIGDRNVIRECVTLNRGTVQDQGLTSIGSDNLFMAYVHVAHDATSATLLLANKRRSRTRAPSRLVIMGGLSADPPVWQVVCTPSSPTTQRYARRAAVRHGRRPAGGRPRVTPKGSSAAASRRAGPHIRSASRAVRSGLKLADRQRSLRYGAEQPELGDRRVLRIHASIVLDRPGGLRVSRDGSPAFGMWPARRPGQPRRP